MDTPTRSFTIRRPGDLGAAISEVRHDRGLTQAELAAQVGVRRPYLSAIENGRSTRLLGHLLRALRRMGAEVTVTWPVAAHKVPPRDS